MRYCSHLLIGGWHARSLRMNDLRYLLISMAQPLIEQTAVSSDCCLPLVLADAYLYCTPQQPQKPGPAAPRRPGRINAAYNMYRLWLALQALSC